MRVITLRLKSGEKVQYEKAAEKLGMAFSDWMREALKTKAQE
jgi:hypothetical protein